MTAIASTVANWEMVPNADLKTVIFQTRDDVDATNTYEITLADFGISATGLLIVEGFVHTANGSVITIEANTCAVSAGVLTITVGAGTDNDARVFRITGVASAPTFAA